MSNVVHLGYTTASLLFYGNTSIIVYSDSGGTYSSQSDNTSIATTKIDFVSNPSGGSGTYYAYIYSAGSGTATITVTSAETTYYKAGSATITVTVATPTTEIKNITSSGFDVYAYNISYYGVNKVQFPTWTDYNGQDDLIWHTASHQGNGTWYYHVNVSNHNNESGTYITHFYAFNKSDQAYCFGAIGGINVPVINNFAAIIKKNNTLVTSAPTLTKSSSSTGEVGFYKSTATNSGNPTYYFRGAVTNNYVTFAGLNWRIVRINEDDTVRLVNIENLATKTKYSSSSDQYNSMYYTDSSNLAKTQVDNWYTSKLSSYESYIAEGYYFCEQAKVTNANGKYVKSGVKMTTLANYSADFKCSNDANGKGLVYGKVGLLNIDEVLFAGGYDAQNKTYYLKAAQYYWTMSPAGSQSVWRVHDSGGLAANTLTTSAYYSGGVVINLKSTVIPITGNGTSTNPYKIT